MSVCRLNRYQQPKRFCVEQKSAAKNSAQSTKTTATAVEKESSWTGFVEELGKVSERVSVALAK